MQSLKELAEIEARAEDFSDSPLTASRRVLIFMMVRAIYRPARLQINYTDPWTQNKGKTGMAVFARLQLELAQQIHDLDWEAALLARHNAAHAFGFLGEEGQARQCKMNREILLELEQSCHRTWNADKLFVRQKVFWGLVENDKNFASTLTLDQLQAAVNELETARDQNFPGRALSVAKEYERRGWRQEAVALLERAACCQFGNVSQIIKAEGYLAQLTGVKR